MASPPHPVPYPGRRRHDPRRTRLLAVACVAALHGLVYFGVTRLSLLRPETAFIDPRTWLDDRIPHLPGLWPLYWLPYLLVPVGGARLVLGMDEGPFRRLVVTWASMILVGGTIQVLFPARAPWPAAPAPSQQAFHASPFILPFATLPSMHVAHVALGAGVAAFAARTPLAWALAAGGVGTVAFSTLALKEHLVLDAVAGLLLAAAALWWWRRGRHAA